MFIIELLKSNCHFLNAKNVRVNFKNKIRFGFKLILDVFFIMFLFG